MSKQIFRNHSSLNSLSRSSLHGHVKKDPIRCYHLNKLHKYLIKIVFVQTIFLSIFAAYFKHCMYNTPSACQYIILAVVFLPLLSHIINDRCSYFMHLFVCAVQ